MKQKGPKPEIATKYITTYVYIPVYMYVLCDSWIPRQICACTCAHTSSVAAFPWGIPYSTHMLETPLVAGPGQWKWQCKPHWSVVVFSWLVHQTGSAFNSVEIH